MPKETAKTGIAGEFWFFSQLHMLGYTAYITFGNTKGIDISVQLGNDVLLTFDVKSKFNFGGSFQYLDNVKKEKRKNHFIAFVDLQLEKESIDKKETGKRILRSNPRCYIVKFEDLHNIAFDWVAKSGSGAKGYGFEAKLLPFLKSQGNKGITRPFEKEFKKRQKIDEIDFDLYNSIIWTIEDFENNYFNIK